MSQKYPEVIREYKDLEKKLGDPDILSRTPQSDLKKMGERFALLRDVAREIETHAALQKERDESAALMRDANPDIAALARSEHETIERAIRDMEKKMYELLHPDPHASVRRVILEIRAGAGGDEASLFAAELLRMYQRFSERMGWRFSVVDSSPSDVGGTKEAVAEIEGKGAYQKLKHEMGVHRVQRVPDTEKSGRVHTSTASVAILPEAEDVDIDIKPQDITVEFFRSSGPGGQNVNKVETAVRITHVPSGLVVASQEGRSQLKNRERAMTILRTKLLDARRQTEEAKRATERKEQIGTADRSEKIRTYNFPQDRVTDHRINQSWHHIERIMDGDIGPIIEAFEK